MKFAPRRQVDPIVCFSRPATFVGVEPEHGIVVIDGGVRTVDQYRQPHLDVPPVKNRYVRFLSLRRTDRYARQTAIARIEKHNWTRIAEHLDLRHGSGARAWPVLVHQKVRALPHTGFGWRLRC